MRLAMFAQCMYAPWIEGIKNNSLFLGKELDKHMEIEIISHLPPKDSIEDSNKNDLHINFLLKLSDNFFLQVYYYFIWAIKSLIFIYQKKIQVISFQYLETSFILSMIFLAFFKWNTIFLLTIYSTDELSISYKKYFLKLFRWKFKKIIIISEYLRPSVRCLWFKDEDIVYIPISYDKKRYSYSSPSENRKKNTILFSAWPIKEAWSFLMVDLAKLLPEYHFIFAMRFFNRKSEKEMEILQSYIKSSGVENIEILRNITDMPKLLWEISWFVLPLQDINIKMLIPVALLEAMARWNLCFVSDLPNLALLVKDQDNAVLFDKKNVLELRDKIVKFIDNQDIPHNAQNFWSQFPDYITISSQYISLINSIQWSN